MSDATEITSRAKSNLAFALKILPPQRRHDMVVFYAFCRVMDDLADDPRLPIAERSAALQAWKTGLTDGFSAPTALQLELLEIRKRCDIPNDLLTAIIDGCEIDLHPQRFHSWDELAAYIWKVACAVGLVSIRLFGCTDAASAKYAVALGNALQLTNILRDVSEDLLNGGRIYLPLDEMRRFGLSEDELSDGVDDERFLQMMKFQAARAEQFFQEAAALLPANDRRALRPARIMGGVYQDLLHQMQRDGFQVFSKRYRVSTGRKLYILLRELIR